MYTRVLDVDGAPRLAFFARTDIRPGQARPRPAPSVSQPLHVSVVVQRGPLQAAVVGLRANWTKTCAAQELTYDYRFKEEAGEDKLPCGCGAPSCRGYLN